MDSDSSRSHSQWTHARIPAWYGASPPPGMNVFPYSYFTWDSLAPYHNTGVRDPRIMFDATRPLGSTFSTPVAPTVTPENSPSPFVPHHPSVSQSTMIDSSQGAHTPTSDPSDRDLSQLLEHVAGIKSGMQTALSDLHSIKNAQRNLGDRVGSLEGILGVTRKKKAVTRGKKAKGKEKELVQGSELELTAALSESPVANVLDRLGTIEFSLEELLQRTEKSNPIKSL